jgi:hypothetical protein
VRAAAWCIPAQRNTESDQHDDTGHYSHVERCCDHINHIKISSFRMPSLGVVLKTMLMNGKGIDLNQKRGCKLSLERSLKAQEFPLPFRPLA